MLRFALLFTTSIALCATVLNYNNSKLWIIYRCLIAAEEPDTNNITMCVLRLPEAELHSRYRRRIKAGENDQLHFGGDDRCL
jgi:hypothetical protein